MTPPADDTITPLRALGPIMLCIIFGANGVAIKVSLTGMGTFCAAGTRFAIAATVVAMWAWATGRPFGIAKGNRAPLLLLSALFTVQLALFYVGLSKTLASRGALIVNAVPFFVLLFAHMFIPGDRMTLRKVLGMGFGFGGVALVLLEGSGLHADIYAGDWIIFLAAVVWGANAVYTKSIIHRYRPFQLVLYPSMLAAPIHLTVGWFWDDAMLRYIDTAIVMAMAYQSIISAAIGFVVWSSMLRRYGASTLHSFVFIMPIAGVIASNVILKEPIGTNLMAAVVLVAAGIAMVNIRPQPAPPTYPMGRTY